MRKRLKKRRERVYLLANDMSKPPISLPQTATLNNQAMRKGNYPSHQRYRRGRMIDHVNERLSDVVKCRLGFSRFWVESGIGFIYSPLKYRWHASDATFWWLMRHVKIVWFHHNYKLDWHLTSSPTKLSWRVWVGWHKTVWFIELNLDLDTLDQYSILE